MLAPLAGRLLWMLPCASALAAGCSSDPSPTVPSGSCATSARDFTVAPSAEAGPLDAGAPGPICYPPLSAPGVDGGLSCDLLVVLPGAADESACAAAGLTAPSSTLVADTQSRLGAKGAICIVPEASAGDDGGPGCGGSEAPVWCVRGGATARAAGCVQVFDASATALRLGSSFSLVCALGC